MCVVVFDISGFGKNFGVFEGCGLIFVSMGESNVEEVCVEEVE